MIGALPTSLTVDSKEYEIRSDYRVALLIFQALDNPDLTKQEKCLIYLQSLYKEIPENIEEAFSKAAWFLDGGSVSKSKKAPARILDWEQDEHIIFPAINKAAGFETRSADYLHWWTFLGYFNEIGEGLFSQVMNIRSKRSKHKKLEKWEEEFYKDHKELIDLKRKYSTAEKAQIDRLNELLS